MGYNTTGHKESTVAALTEVVDSREGAGRSYLRVTAIYTVGFYLLPKIMGRTGRFVYDGLQLNSLGCKQKQKNTNSVQ